MGKIDLKQKAQQIRDERGVGGNTAYEVGGLIEDIIENSAEQSALDEVSKKMDNWTGVYRLIATPLDASKGLYPTFSINGGSATDKILAGDMYVVGVAGTVGGKMLAVNDTVTAIKDSPSQSPTDWIVQRNFLGGYLPLSGGIITGDVLIVPNKGIVSPSGRDGILFSDLDDNVTLGSTMFELKIRTKSRYVYRELPNGVLGYMYDVFNANNMDVNWTCNNLQYKTQTQVSDYRTKKGFKNLSLEGVERIKPYRFKYKSNGEITIGYIAQEVEKIMPNSINRDIDGIMGMNTQEVLIAKVERLEQELCSSKNTINQLKDNLQLLVDKINTLLPSESAINLSYSAEYTLREPLLSYEEEASLIVESEEYDLHQEEARLKKIEDDKLAKIKQEEAMKTTLIPEQ